MPYRIAITTTRPLDAASVEAIPGVQDVTLEETPDGQVVRLRAQEAPRATVALTRLAEDAGATVVDLAVRPASLEDVFLALTGRGLAG